jgi:hypothetical protein
MSPKRKKDKQIAQTVLVKTIIDVSWGYFAVYKRNHGFSPDTAWNACKKLLHLRSAICYSFL